MNILTYRDFPLDQIIYEKPTRSKDNTYISEAVLRKDDGETEQIFIQTPGLLNVGGVVRTGNRAHLELAIDKEHSDFYDFIANVDRNAMDVIEKNSEMWFGQKFPRQIVEDFYRSVLKPGREQTTPCMKLNLPVEGEEVMVDFLNKDKKTCLYTDVPVEAKTVVVMQFMGLRFLKQQVISLWKPVQVLVNDVIESKDQDIYIQDNLLSDEEVKVEAPEEATEEATEESVEEATEESVENNVENVLKEAPKEEEQAITIETESLEDMERPENPPNYEEVKNMLERTETESVEPRPEDVREQELLDTLSLELDEVQMEETDVPAAQEEPVVAEEAQVEQEEPVAEEIPTLTDDFLENMTVESEEESGEESGEEGESTVEEYKEAFQYLENELEKRDEVIKTLKRQMSGMLNVLENVEDEQN